MTVLLFNPTYSNDIEYYFNKFEMGVWYNLLRLSVCWTLCWHSHRTWHISHGLSPILPLHVTITDTTCHYLRHYKPLWNSKHHQLSQHPSFNMPLIWIFILTITWSLSEDWIWKVIRILKNQKCFITYEVHFKYRFPLQLRRCSELEPNHFS